jgi:hypothetical protein
MAVHRCAKPHGDLDQNVVTGLMAEQVVDRLEAVEVEDADGEGRRILGAVADQAVDLVLESTMIAEPRQGIGEGKFVFPVGPAGGKQRLHRNPCLLSVFR